MRIYLLIIIGGILLLSPRAQVLAIPPPDFIIAVGSQIGQIFAIIAVVLSAIVAAMSQFLRVFITKLKHKKLLVGLLAVIVLAVSLVSAYYYDQYLQDQAYEQWVKESEQEAKDVNLLNNGLDNLDFDEDQNEPNMLGFEDPKTMFIYDYYQLIKNHQFEEAYAISKKSVPFETFVSWYENVDDIKLDSILPVTEEEYSFSLSLDEAGERTRYAVLMTVGRNEKGYFVESSTVRVLSTNQISDNKLGAETNGSFFEQNKSTPLFITNEEFQEELDLGEDVFVLDAREDAEYDIGTFPGSHHIRFADLIAGEWISVPTDKPIYVICWSGIRGEDTATFLRSKKILARYLENGAHDWVDQGGLWEGEISFSAVYNEPQHKKVFTTEEMVELIESNVAIVDSRHQDSYNDWHIPGSVSIPIIYTPTSEIENKIKYSIPPNSTVVTVCDDFVSCFYAKVTGIKLEKSGHTFLGRYNRPWEYRDL